MHVETASGTVRGLVHDGVARFLGIPFAAPAVGANRFAYPQPLPAWQGVFAALEPGPAPIQPPAIGLGMRGATRTAEDCLFLNVFVPAARAVARPVFVWIFGGGYIYGDGADPLFDGTHLAREQDLVVVTLNYRLGLWGFAPLEAANVGLADQVAALRWIQDHIAAFGGDPGNVTIVGESAGAMSVCNLLACPAAHGLFHRAIAQSGAAESVVSRADALETAAVIRAALPCEPADADVATLLDAQRATFDRLRGTRRGSPFRPHVDGEWLPQQPLAAAAAGADIPLIMGINKDEQRLYVRPSLQFDDAALVAHIERRLTEQGIVDVTATTARVLDHYRTQRPQHPRNPNAAILADIETELRFRRPMLRYASARGRRTWLYQFDWPSPALNGWLGATHAVEIPFVFGNFEQRATAKFVGAGPDAITLSRQIMNLWGHFVRYGEPPPPWQRFTADDPMQLHLDRRLECLRADADATVAMWNELLADQLTDNGRSR
jgi:para-nitrobenzyl esterase